MKFGSDKTKYLSRIFAVILLFAAVWLLLYLVPEKKSPAEKAAELLNSGAYTEAAELYLSQGDSEMYQHCLQLYAEQQYISAVHRLQMADYAAAMEKFALLQNYKDSRNLLDACRYLWAGELAGAGDYSKARKLCLELEAYPGKAELLQKCNEGIMALAGELALEGDYVSAAELLQPLGDYADAELMNAQAKLMAQWRTESQNSPILDRKCRFTNAYYEHVYKTELAYVVLPEKCSADCRFLLYFPGGKDEEINIDFLLYYLMNPAPDTIAVFLRTNGIYDIEHKCREALSFMEKVAAECGVFIREIVSCGSSLGAYPAMQSAVYIPELSGIKLPSVLSLDAGDDWNSPYCLNRSQCIACAERGTEFYLFESPWVGTDRAAIRRMVETGNEVILVGCTYDEHVRITLDAMGMGVLHWAVGDRKEACELDIYNFTKLKI